MNTFVCNICGIEFPKNEKVNKYKRCVQCHKEKEKERRLLNWKQIFFESQIDINSRFLTI